MPDNVADVTAPELEEMVQPLQLHFGAEEEEFPELGNIVTIFPYQGHDLITPRSGVSTPETHPDLKFQDSVMCTLEKDVGLGHKLLINRVESRHCLVKYVPAKVKVLQWLQHCSEQRELCSTQLQRWMMKSHSPFVVVLPICWSAFVGLTLRMLLKRLGRAAG